MSWPWKQRPARRPITFENCTVLDHTFVQEMRVEPGGKVVLIDNNHIETLVVPPGEDVSFGLAEESS